MKRIRNPVTGTWYEVRQRSSKAGLNRPVGLWARVKNMTNDSISEKKRPHRRRKSGN